MRPIVFLLLSIAIFTACKSVKPPPPKALSKTPTELSHIDLPEGFSIEYFAKDVTGARSMIRADDGTVFVGTRNKKSVYALFDYDKDYQADSMMVVIDGLFSPNGVALRGDDLYVGEVNRIIRFPGILKTLPDVPDYEIVYDGFPSEKHHGWKFIAFEPGFERLWVPVGAPCNVCENEDSIFASITSMKYDGTDLRIEAHGVRNSVGFDWNEETGDFYFTDNGRDWMGDDLPPCELNKLSERGQHFGFPYCHGSEVIDPDFSEGKPCNQYQGPVQDLGAHVAALGVLIHSGNGIPAEYKGQAFIAEHGSWNRSTRIGYQLSLVRLNAEGQSTSYEPFAHGWMLNEKVSGRPVALLELPDGSILVSDDYADCIYRISYSGNK